MPVFEASQGAFQESVSGSGSWVTGTESQVQVGDRIYETATLSNKEYVSSQSSISQIWNQIIAKGHEPIFVGLEYTGITYGNLFDIHHYIVHIQYVAKHQFVQILVVILILIFLIAAAIAASNFFIWKKEQQITAQKQTDTINSAQNIYSSATNRCWATYPNDSVARDKCIAQAKGIFSSTLNTVGSTGTDNKTNAPSFPLSTIMMVAGGLLTLGGLLLFAEHAGIFKPKAVPAHGTIEVPTASGGAS